MEYSIKFSDEQFNKIFPYFIRIDKTMSICSVGKALEKIYPGLEGKQFSDHLELKRPLSEMKDFNALTSLHDQLLVLEFKNNNQIQLRGQIELLEKSQELLFLGSPWFNSIEQVLEQGLNFNDFALHDPMIDLLHVLKTHEITTGDLKALLKTINLQRQQLKKTSTEFEKLSMVASANKNGVLFTDKNGKITWVNESVQRMSGYSAQDMIGKTPIELFRGPATDSTVLREMVKNFEAGEAFNVQLVFYRPTGDYFWGECKGQPILDPQGNVLQYFTIIEDITTSKNLEEAVRNNEQKYRDIITNMNLGLLEVDRNETITFANRSFCEISGYEMEELDGKIASDLFANSEGKKIIRQKMELRNLGISDVYEMAIYNKAGEKKWWLISATPRYDNKKQLTGSIGIHLDITAQKNLEHDLIESREKARHLARTKEAFLANMSHEIRTPMNAIIGLGNQLAKSILTDEQEFFLEMIQRASQNLLVIINDILDLTKIEAGKLNIEFIGFDAAAVLNDTIQVLKHKAEEKNILLKEAELDKRCSAVLMGDPHRLTQILTNMLGNAIKFTETGHVTVSLAVLKDEATHQLLELKISDTGIGMDAAFLKTIFESFSQEDESISRKFGGTGLGMTISKQLIELMGGSIDIKSEKGIGTVATISIRFSKGQASDLPSKNAYQPASHTLFGKKILVVDDNDLNRLVVTKLLQDYDAEVIEAVNGMEAIVQVQKNHPDMILMDLQMPVLNGLDASRMIRNRGYKKTIIAVTANAIKGESKKCFDAGMNDYITKPFRESELMQKVETWLNNNGPVSATPVVAIESPSHSNNKEEFDLTDLYSMAAGDLELVNTMIQLFCEQTSEVIQQLSDARKENDKMRIGLLAHKIKPDLDSLGIKSLYDDIRLLEKAGKNDLSFDIIDPLIEKIRTKIKPIIGKLRSKPILP